MPDDIDWFLARGHESSFIQDETSFTQEWQRVPVKVERAADAFADADTSLR
jgi:hypothetical protein